jgi:hypothetical protein
VTSWDQGITGQKDMGQRASEHLFSGTVIQRDSGIMRQCGRGRGDHATVEQLDRRIVEQRADGQ